MLDTEKEWYIQAPWGRICIVAWGSCLNPPVLLCHGGMDSAASWRPIMELMPDKFYYIGQTGTAIALFTGDLLVYVPGMELPGNGRSDPFPRGLMVSIHDLVYSIEAVRKHFRWDHFVFMAHSLGTVLGKLYNLAYPGRMSKVVDFDPMPAYRATTEEQFALWYHHHFTNYYKKYDVYNSPKENTPIYTRDQAIETLMSNRGLTAEAAGMVLERISEPVRDGLVRYTFDQRNKVVMFPPFTHEQMQKFYTNIKTPTLTIAASQSVERGAYSKTPFALDETYYQHNNYRVVHVQGEHDVHVIHPERMATVVVQFLLYGVAGLDSKAKL